MLIADIITEEDRLRYEALPEGPTKRGYARRYDNEVLRRMGYLIGEPAGPTPGWRLFPDDAVEITHKQLTVKKAFGLQQGFTLIELAAVMLIAGLALAAFLGMKRVEIVQHKIDTTKQSVERVQDALAAYNIKNGYYPCPAPLDAVQGTEQFGRAGQCDSTLNPVTTGQCSGGHCVRAGRLFDHDSDPATALQPIRVRIGAVPAADLGLRPDHTKDAYGNMLVYAVTERLAIDAATVSTIDGGAIDIVDQNGDTLLDNPQTAEFVVLSHGRDKAGAFVYGTGVKALPCPAGSQQTANCNLDALNQPARFSVSPWSTAGSNQQFDDVVAWNMPLMGSPAPSGGGGGTAPFTLNGSTSCPPGYKAALTGKRLMFQHCGNSNGSIFIHCTRWTASPHCIGSELLKLKKYAGFHWPSYSGTIAPTNYKSGSHKGFGHYIATGDACAVCVSE